MHARELMDLALTELGLECSVQDSLQDASTYLVLRTLYSVHRYYCSLDIK